MWIIRCIARARTTFDAPTEFVVGPFGSDDEAEILAAKLQHHAGLTAVVLPLVEPARARIAASA